MPVRPPRTVSMTTRDGVRLDADIHEPDAPGPFPVLLMRQPYGRSIASTVVYAHPQWYAAHGYIVVVQDVRGCGTSAGEFRLFDHEVEDGADSVAWAAGLPGSTGVVGMYGFSYQGNTQLLALAGGAPALKALCPAMVGWDMHDDWAYEGGAFRLADNLGWGIQMAAEAARRRQDFIAHQALYAAARVLPLDEELPTHPRVLRGYARYSHYDDWLGHPQPGPFWDRISPRAALTGKPVDVPMLHIGGWFDQMLTGTLGAFKEIAARTDAPQRLIVGPWTHMPWIRKVGSVDFGPEAASPVDREQIAWFDRFLKGQPAPDAPAVDLFDLGTGHWRSFDALPDPEPSHLHIATTGLAAVSTEEGRLVERPSGTGVDRIVHDPWRPVPTVGGHAAIQAGMRDRSEVDQRGDVACYTTEPLSSPVTLAGPVALELAVLSDAASFDVSAVLSRVEPDGRVLNLTQGHARVEEGAATLPLRVAMRAVCATVPAGCRLRLSLAGACFPAFPVNPGTGAEAAETRLVDCRTITLAFHTAGTRLTLPLLKAV
ncbi:Peptidase S15 [Skermanella stibiiresistens SB22]|uniref:Peptidase S15 n=1 Tax=Skermanella stibiiresistens SB22 TaxID=1385369 RepID=W9H8Y2_9PROT|nr:Peptidase S15 [Skermanella stibiiresistens SB22]